MLRRLSVVVAIALAAIIGLVPGAQATRGPVPADGTYVTCKERPGLTYVMVAGAPIYVWSWADMGIGAPATTAINCSNNGEAAGSGTPWYPTTDGTYVQGLSGGAAAGPVYVIVGGAPVTAPSPSGTIEHFDQRSLPPAPGPEQSTVAGTPVYGMFSAVVRNGYFRSPAGTLYRTDGGGHPFVATGLPSGRVAPTLSQTSIDSCERLACSPWGDLTVGVVGKGRIRVSGYALDALTTRQVTVHLEGAGRSYDVLANQPDASVNAGYGVSGSHGFNRVLSVAAGRYVLCTTFRGYAPGVSTPAGCQVIKVPGAKPGRAHRPRVKTHGHGAVVVHWKKPALHGSPVRKYVVRTSTGKKVATRGASRHLVIKHLPRGREISVQVRAITYAGAGKYSPSSKTVHVR